MGLNPDTDLTNGQRVKPTDESSRTISGTLTGEFVLTSTGSRLYVVTDSDGDVDVIPGAALTEDYEIDDSEPVADTPDDGATTEPSQTTPPVA